MLCPVCGKEVDENLSACDMCGAVLEATPSSENKAPDTASAQTSAETPVETAAPTVFVPTPEMYAPVYPAGNTLPPYTPMPVRKKRKKWPIVVTCCVLAFLIGLYSVFSALLSQPVFVLTQAYDKTFISSQNLSFDASVTIDGEELDFDGKFVKGETPDDNLFYLVLESYVELEMGFYNGKLYSSFGEFDLEDSAQWDDVEETLAEEYDVEADVEDIYMRLTADDLTLEEKAAIYDEEIFPILETVIFVVYGEEVDFPPYLDMVTSVQYFFTDFFYKYLVLTEQDSDEGHLYEYEISIEAVLTDFHDYMESDETLSQLVEILDIVYEDWDNFFLELQEDDEEILLIGEIFVNDDGYFDSIDGELDEIEFEVSFYDIDETELDENDIKDIDILFDMGEMTDIYEGEYDGMTM